MFDERFVGYGADKVSAHSNHSLSSLSLGYFCIIISNNQLNPQHGPRSAHTQTPVEMSVCAACFFGDGQVFQWECLGTACGVICLSTPRELAALSAAAGLSTLQHPIAKLECAQACTDKQLPGMIAPAGGALPPGDAPGEGDAGLPGLVHRARAPGPGRERHGRCESPPTTGLFLGYSCTDLGSENTSTSQMHPHTKHQGKGEDLTVQL